MGRTHVAAGVALAALGLVVGLAGCASGPNVSNVSPTDGAGLVNAACNGCHPMNRVAAAHKDRGGWTAAVDRMRSHGLNLTDQQVASIVDYLTKRDGGS